LNYISVVWAILRKDLLNEKRSFVTLGAMFVFSLIVILVFLFAFDLAVNLRSQAATGIIWVTICFAGTLSLDKTMAMESDSDGIDGLRLAPFDSSVIFIAKVLTNWIFLLITAVIVIAAYTIFTNVSLITPGFYLIILLGTLGYVLIGTLIGTLNMKMKTRGPLLSVLLFPLIIPLLLAAVNASSLILTGTDPHGLHTWLGVLTGYDLLFLAAGLLLYDKVLDE